MSPTDHGVNVKWSVWSESLLKKARPTYLYMKLTNNEKKGSQAQLHVVSLKAP